MSPEAAILSTEHEMFRQTCHKFYQKQVEPYYLEWEKAAEGTLARMLHQWMR
ncbi:MAG: acyl-CoA dehydrogenase family protein [Halieaceae bacterium]|nr:acyl-CoA dehydrogenase family protein [Halieaceae bacterium]